MYLTIGWGPENRVEVERVARRHEVELEEVWPSPSGLFFSTFRLIGEPEKVGDFLAEIDA